MSLSFLHEGLLWLVRDRPAFVAELLSRLLDVPIPPFAEARLAEAALNEVIPVEYHADAVVLLVEDKPVFGIIVEAQLQQDDRKCYTWPLYAVGARARHRCPFVVVVVTSDLHVARWAGQPIHLGGGVFHPSVIGPEQIPKLTDPAQAVRDPQLAVLSVAAHGKGDVDTAVQIALAASEALKGMSDKDQRVLYSGLIEKALSRAAAEIFNMLPQTKEFFSESQRHSYDRGIDQGRAEGRDQGRAEGRDQGRVEGESKALLKILTQRGLAIAEAQHRRIVSCADVATLDRWLDRALAVTSVDELLG